MALDFEIQILTPEEAERIFGRTKRIASPGSRRPRRLADIIEHAGDCLPALACVSCDAEFAPRAWPFLYCSEWCRHFAKQVRYERARGADSTSVRLSAHGHARQLPEPRLPLQ